MISEPKQSIHAEIVAQGADWHLSRVESRRTPMLGAVVTSGPWHQIRVFESGGAVVGQTGEANIFGPGHQCSIASGTTFLYLPMANAQPAVEWVLSWTGQTMPDDIPEIVRRPSPMRAITIPIAAPSSDVLALYPTSLQPWLGFPPNVATWAEATGVRATSLTQRTTRLAGESPKRILSSLRATIAFEIAFDYLGRGASLAIETGYASQAHLAADIRNRFGLPLSRLMTGHSSPQLDWLKLLRSVIR